MVERRYITSNQCLCISPQNASQNSYQTKDCLHSPLKKIDCLFVLGVLHRINSISLI